MTTTSSNAGPYDASAFLGRALDLPCGAVLKNRLIKSAMSDSLGNGEGDPTILQARLYERWAEGGAALSIIGEAQVDPAYPEKPGNLVLEAGSDRTAFLSLVERGTRNGTHLWPQLGHAGALSYQPISNPKGPSPLDLPGLRCGGMTVEEVEALPGLYAKAAAFAKNVGFTGVFVHAGHGFLLSQFLSPLFNRRTDRYGGSMEARSGIILAILAEVRGAVGPAFPVGIKINSTDRLEGGLTEEDALTFVELLDRSSVDIIDISGGTYFPGAKASSDTVSGGGPYFLSFARRARQATSIPLMLTGGFTMREQAVSALVEGSTDAVSLARAMVLDPGLPKKWLTGQGGDPDFPRFSTPPEGGITAWYSMRLTALGEDAEDAFTMDPATALNVYDNRDTERVHAWSRKFG